MRVECDYCGNKLEKTDAESLKGKYYHKDCYNEMLGRKEVFKYVAKLFHFKSETRPGPRILQQMNIFREKEYTTWGILNALKYWYEVKKGNAEKANEGIWAVTFCYDEAQEYYKKLNYKKEKIAETIVEQINKKPVVIEVKKQNEKKEKPLYNLEELL